MQRPWGRKEFKELGKEANGVSGERAKEVEFRMRWGRRAGSTHPGCCSPMPHAQQSFLGEEGVMWKLSGVLSLQKRAQVTLP